MLNTKYFFFLILFFNLSSGLFAQFHGFKEIPDSLITESYNSLYSDYYQFIDSVEWRENFATAYLEKAYLEKDTLNINNGYYLITYHDEERFIGFNDSLLKYSAYLPEKEANIFAWYAYQGKGGYYYDKRDFKKAFDNHIKALKVTNYNSEYYNISTTNLGLLKERTGRYKEALIDYKENYKYELENFKNLDSINSFTLEAYLNSMCLLANSYRLNKKYDSAQFLNKKVIYYKNQLGAERFMGTARLNSAEVLFELKKFQNTIDSINMALPILIKYNNIGNSAIAYYLRGMSKSKLGLKNSLEDLIQMDSLFNIKSDLHPSLRPGYVHLINKFKKDKNTVKQLYYLEQLLKFDSVVYDYKRHIIDGVYLQERKKLQNTQKKLRSNLDNTSLKYKIVLLVSFLLLLVLVFEIIRRKKRNKKILYDYQIKFDNLVNEKSIVKETKKQKLNISESLVDTVVLKLEAFTERNGFLDKDITAIKLAKELHTNPNYLGQIIKHKYGKSFRQYINGLRINYILKVIRENQKIKNYSIEAIAREAGFNHAEPFSKAFRSKMGDYPSEFISKIKNK